MNKRIRELAEQAGYKDLPTVRLAFQGFDKEKFAELILSEVISTIYRSDINNRKQEKLVEELAYKFGFK